MSEVSEGSDGCRCSSVVCVYADGSRRTRAQVADVHDVTIELKSLVLREVLLLDPVQPPSVVFDLAKGILNAAFWLKACDPERPTREQGEVLRMALRWLRENGHETPYSI